MLVLTHICDYIATTADTRMRWKRVAGKSYQAIRGSDLTPSFPSSMNHCSIRNNRKHHCKRCNIAICAIVK